MKYLIEWRPRARKDLGRLDPEVRGRVVDAVNQLSEDQSGIRQLVGYHPPLFRIRIGAWRILFSIEAGIAIVQRVLPRDKAYRQ
jgi:mRNA-degrading endonuclease RelE of RelBE toxin-antitoxin system